MNASLRINTLHAFYQLMLFSFIWSTGYKTYFNNCLSETFFLGCKDSVKLRGIKRPSIALPLKVPFSAEEDDAISYMKMI